MKTMMITAHDFETNEAFRFGSMRWRGVAVKENGIGRVYFYDCERPKRIVTVDNVKPGDYVWCNAAGTETTAGKCHLPSDARLRYLWEKGFKKSTRINHPAVDVDVYEELGGDFTPSNYENGYTMGSWHMVGLNHFKVEKEGKVLFYGIVGRVNNTNNTITKWYMSPKCSLKELQKALANW